MSDAAVSTTAASGPIRTCVGCRRTDRQVALVRVARTGGACQVDRRRRLPGRGAYVHADPACLQQAVGGLARSFRAPVSRAEVARLTADLLTPPVSAPETHAAPPAVAGVAIPGHGQGHTGVVDIATRAKA
ncbi:MAG: YlxR family protein [Deltaproteobacteria bacterium]|nr:YlxR family protein [Deltaproteobacteria bacterium]